jgi:hypothetical protein
VNPGIEPVWKRIRFHSGEPFSTNTGARFTYHVEGATLMVDRSGYGVARSNFQRALDLLPLGGPEDIRHLVRGSAYVWAILHDPRIRQTDW